jgi:protein-tyrosine-phosphatase
MAVMIYNKLKSGHGADSAGTHVEKPGQTLLERKKELPGKSFVVDVMKDIGIDVSSNVSTQLTQDMLSKYDVVVSMAGKRYIPVWLAKAPNYIYWKITDPMGRSHVATATARDAIYKKISESIGSGTI